MKKLRSLILVLLCAAMLMTLAGCGEKTPVTAADFKNITEEMGYYHADATSQYAEHDYVSNVYLACKEDMSYQVEFYEFTNEPMAFQFYVTNKVLFSNSQKKPATEKENMFANYAEYELTTDGKYKALFYIDKTVVYIDVKEEYRPAVEEILKAIGY